MCRVRRASLYEGFLLCRSGCGDRTLAFGLVPIIGITDNGSCLVPDPRSLGADLTVASDNNQPQETRHD
jgi:hypothetical protein